MVVQSKIEGGGVRFGAYVQELRDFFRSRELPFGSPGDLVGFAERVGKPGPFQDEMGSMVRSISFQESETLGRAELLEILTTAVGGSAVGTGAQDVQEAVRGTFMFVNGALRQQGSMFPAEPQVDEEEVTAGDVLAAATAQERTGGRSVAGRSPENGHYGRKADALDEADAVTPGRSAVRGEPTHGGMLFRAVSMSDADAADVSLRQWEGGRRRWLVPAIVAAVIAFSVGGYLARPFLDHPVRNAGIAPRAPQVGPVLAPGLCAGPAAAGTSRASLAQRSMWAHRLLDQGLYAAALPELRSIAEADPGFPGVYLDESDALLHLKRPEDAREAVETQMGVSECMAKLPAPALDSYCAAEFSVAAGATCRPELARIREAAQLQAAMVHLELGHRFEPEGAAAGPEPTSVETPTHAQTAAGHGSSPLRLRRAEPLPAATEGDNARPDQRSVASAKPGPAQKKSRKPQSDDSLVKGDGTDLSLGAYSKPQ